MAKKYMTFNTGTSGKPTIEFRDYDKPVNPASNRLVVWNETDQKPEDVIKETIVKTWQE